MYAIEAHHLGRTFRPRRGLFRAGPVITAVDGVDLAIPAGTIFGLLGPNGAGKTTTIKMLATLLIPTSGTARVAGFDVVRQEREVRQRLGVVLGGDRGLYGKLSARDNLIYFGHLFGMPRQRIGPRADALLERVGLAERAEQRVEGFSRGMKQRLHLARALLHDPPVVFLDEPTIGLDPAAAVILRQIVKDLVPGHTVLLTTHYLAEADALCDRIAIIDQGRILVEDSPAGIKRRVSGTCRYQVQVRGPVDANVTTALRMLPGVQTVTTVGTQDGTTRYVLTGDDDADLLGPRSISSRASACRSPRFRRSNRAWKMPSCL